MIGLDSILGGVDQKGRSGHTTPFRGGINLFECHFGKSNIDPYCSGFRLRNTNNQIGHSIREIAIGHNLFEL